MLVSYLPLRRSETSIFISVKCKDIEESLKKMWTKILKLIWWNEIAQSQSKDGKCWNKWTGQQPDEDEKLEIMLILNCPVFFSVRPKWYKRPDFPFHPAALFAYPERKTCSLFQIECTQAAFGLETFQFLEFARFFPASKCMFDSYLLIAIFKKKHHHFLRTSKSRNLRERVSKKIG